MSDEVPNVGSKPGEEGKVDSIKYVPIVVEVFNALDFYGKKILISLQVRSSTEKEVMSLKFSKRKSFLYQNAKEA